LIGINGRYRGVPHHGPSLIEGIVNRRNVIVGAGSALVAGAAGAAAWRLSLGSMTEYEAYAEGLRAALVPPDIANVVRYATLGANSHNTQAWRFHVSDRTIDILPDFARRTPIVDPDDHHLFVSLGCAATNLAIAAAASGRPGEIAVAPDNGGVRYEFGKGLNKGSPNADPLLAAIARRQSTRAEYDGRAVSNADLAALQSAATIPGVSLVIVTERAQMSRIRDLVVAGNDDQMADPAFMNELKRWIRFNPRRAMASGDGLFSAASGSPALPTPLGGFAIDRLFNAKSEGDKYARQIDSSAGIAIFIGEREDRDHWIRAGQACQRFALTATSLGLKLAFINQPVEVVRLRSELAGLLGTTKRPDLVLRFGYGPALPYSPRRPVASVMA
jgi:nitroreductase